MLYQTLTNWPVDAAGLAVPSATDEYIRHQAYMASTVKVKVNTSWIQPNEQWDNAMSGFVARILEPGAKNKFLPAFIPLVEQIAAGGDQLSNELHFEDDHAGRAGRVYRNEI